MASDSATPRRPVATLRLHLLPRRNDWVLFSRDVHETTRHRAEEDRRRLPSALPGVDREEDEAAGGTAPRRGRAWSAARRWLATRGRMGERILKEMRLPEKVEVLEVVHPSRLPGAEARELFAELLEEERRRSRRWLLLDGALLPVAAVLTLVPGPNVWAAYLAWRALSHFRAGRGARRAAAELPVRLIAEPRLDPLLELAGERLVWRRRQKIRRIGESLGIHELDAVL